MPKSTPQKLAYQKKRDAQPAQKKKRAMNNAARRAAIRDGKAHVGDNTDVAHIQALSAGGTNAPSNLRVESRSKNRGWRKTASYKVGKDTP